VKTNPLRGIKSSPFSLNLIPLISAGNKTPKIMGNLKGPLNKDVKDQGSLALKKKSGPVNWVVPSLGPPQPELNLPPI